MLRVMQYNPEHDITFDFSNGELLVNATEMAKPFGRLPNEFLRLRTTIEYLNALESATGISRNTLVVTFSGNSPERPQGTWMHRRLAIRFAQWLSAAFAVWVDEKIEELLTTGRVALVPTGPITYKDALIHLLEQVEINEALAAENERLQPKAEFYDAVVSTNDTFTISETAKILNVPGMGQKKLFAFLREHGVLMYNNEPYQRYIDAGWFRCIESIFTDSHNIDRVYRKTVVFQKGVDGILKMLIRSGLIKQGRPLTLSI